MAATKRRKRLPRQAQAARTRAAALAAATASRSRVFANKRKQSTNAKREIQEQLDSEP